MAVATHEETERKYEAGAKAELPALTGVPGVTGVAGPRAEELSAIYYDTADQRLARYGVTLRRRTGGSDAGWHLKVPSGRDSRTELRLPLGKKPAHATNAPPDELVALTTAMTRGAELRPVARIKTERAVWELRGADGEVLAEVTDDRVSARRLGAHATKATGAGKAAKATEATEPGMATGAVGASKATGVTEAAKITGAAGATESGKVTEAIEPGMATGAAGASKVAKAAKGGKATGAGASTESAVDAGDAVGAVEKWREVEVELVSGSADLLDRVEEVLVDKGIRRAGHGSKLARVLPPPASTRPTGKTAGEVLLAYVYDQFATLVTQDLLVRRDAADAVHQMRVAARRLRSALRVYKRLLSGTAPLRAELRWLGRRLAPARDLEVQEKHFHEEIEALPAELVVGPVAARLDKHYGPARAQAHRQVLKTLGDKRYRRLLDALARLLADPPLTARAERPAATELRKHVRKAHRRMARRHSSGEPLHEVRKAAKQYRYGLEVAASGGKARKRAKALTKVLGEHQDGLVAQPVLRELGMRAHAAGENGFTFGLMHEREAARIAAAEREYPECWRRLK